MVAIKNNKYEVSVSKSTIWVLYTICYVILNCLPIVKYSIPYIFAGLFSIVPLLIVSFNDRKYCKILILFCIFGFLHGLIYFVNGYGTWTEIINEPIRCIRYFVPVVLLRKILSSSRKKRVITWFIISGLFLFVAISTLNGVRQNPMLARLLATGSSMSDDIAAYRYQNVGGFEFCYALGFTTPIWLYLLIREKGLKRFFALVPLIIVFYFALQVQYMTLLLICAASVFLVLFFCVKGSLKKLGIIFLSIAILCLLPTIMRRIAYSGVESVLSQKLLNMADVLEGKQQLSDTTSRTRLYFEAFEVFLSNLFVGAANSAAASNAHSTILGAMASSGILGGISICFGMYSCCRETIGNLIQADRKSMVYYICIFLFVMLLFVNPIHYAYEISIVMFLYIPLTLMIFSPNKKSHETVHMCYDTCEKWYVV